ncbi:SPOSA6832_00806 [Sporobolomyces salmonicolor]|uniref:SPOSA6832_00806-mRNA-1:cds n=1 Tax=Sporidiobolus salmonicolor TaxID=5005 RepID=A0A0D6EH55_SPOSA|nr:SPOSA6832_00806 [Sporobolomyces salmonicolor]
MLASSPFALGLALFSVFGGAFAGKTPDGVFDGDTGSTLLDYQPSITSPSGGEVWIAGGQYSASWCAFCSPVCVETMLTQTFEPCRDQTLPSGVNQSEVAQSADLLLGYKLDNETSLHLYWTLASDIPLYAPNPNTVSFTLPTNVTTLDSYILALVGSSHDQSAEFTIVQDVLKLSKASKRNDRGKLRLY